MNITFLIGNGFDINLGLKTQFEHFLNWYIEQSSDGDEDIVKFKELIHGDIKTWSDLEFTLGQKTNTAPLDDAKVFVKCKRNIDKALYTYLQKQNSEYVFSESTEKAVSVFSNSLLNAHTFTNQRTQNKVLKLLTKYSSENRVHHLIDFNYTNYVDRLYKALNSTITTRTFGKFNAADIKGQLIHLHGELGYSMIIGVNDPSQIANETYRTNERVLDCLIKSQMNYTSGDLKDDTAKGVLEKTLLFYVFGMSIGATDKIWWCKVKDALLKQPEAMLIIINYDSEYDPTFPYIEKEFSDDVIKRFFDVTEATDEERAKLMPQIVVKFNTDMFRLKAVKKEPETATV